MVLVRSLSKCGLSVVQGIGSVGPVRKPNFELMTLEAYEFKVTWYLEGNQTQKNDQGFRTKDLWQKVGEDTDGALDGK